MERFEQQLKDATNDLLTLLMDVRPDMLEYHWKEVKRDLDYLKYRLTYLLDEVQQDTR